MPVTMEKEVSTFLVDLGNNGFRQWFFAFLNGTINDVPNANVTITSLDESYYTVLARSSLLALCVVMIVWNFVLSVICVINIVAHTKEARRNRRETPELAVTTLSLELVQAVFRFVLSFDLYSAQGNPVFMRLIS